MLQRMKDKARSGETISYSALIEGSGVGTQSQKALKQILGEIGHEVDECKMPMLTAVVVRKHANENREYIPGDGFHLLAKELGHLSEKASREEEYLFWKDELKRVYNHYKNKS